MSELERLSQALASDAEAWEEQKQVLPEAPRRRARTSAAMIGLALSMGASHLLLPQQDDGAMAAEPMAAEPSAVGLADAPVAPSVPEDQTVAFSFPESSSATHSVREGQTLWQIASLYQVNVNDLASLNGLTPDALLYPGQTLKLPAPSEVAYATYAMSPTVSDVQPSPAADELEAPEPPAAEVPVETATESLDSQLKTEQEVALAELKQKSNALKSSLADLKSLSQSEAASTTAPAFVESSVEPSVAEADVAEPSLPEETEIASRSTAVEIPVMTLPERATESSSKALEPSAQSYAMPEKADNLQAAASPTPAAPKAAEQEAAVVETETAEPKAIASEQVNVPTVPSLAVAIAPQQPESNATLAQPQAVVEAYRVNSGDTLSAIARQHGVSQSELIAFNGIDNPNLIKVDQVLRIPQQSVETPFSVATVTTQPVTIASATPIPVLDEETEAEAQKADSPELPLVVGLTPAAPAEEAATEEGLRVATAPVSRPGVAQPENQSVPQFGAETQLDTYTEGLRAEIIRLREKYQTQRDDSVTVATRNEPVAEPQTVAVVSTSNDAASLGGSRVNPEFKPNQYTNGLQAEIRNLREQKASGQASSQSVTIPVNPPAAPQEQVVAAANIGSASYDPIVKTAIGQSVSPQLPPLAAADTYLPKESATFKGYIWPAEGVLTSGYGYRWGRMHRGIDIAAPVGTPVVAAAPGVVITSGWNDGGYGNLVEIQHPDGSITLYAHNNRNLVRVGQQVDQGQQIAEMGSTGYSTGPHSHFEIHPSGQGAVNPLALLTSRDG